MPVPSSIADLSTTAASNYPAGSDAIGTSLDDYLRTIQAIIKRESSKGSDITAATTIDVPNDGSYFVVTGNTTIAGISDDWNGRACVLKFSGTPQLTHSSGFILPGSANITAAAGDTILVVNESTGVWRVVCYQSVSGFAKAGAATSSGLTMATSRLLGRTTASTGAIEEISVGTGLSLSGGSLSSTASAVQIQPISASVAGNALTISASALSLDFRSTTLGSGAVTTVSGTPANLVISSGSTLGTVSGQQSRIAVLALNNAGTIELAAVNLAGGNDLSEAGLISTTAEGGAGAADSATVVYSTTARTNVAYRVIGYIESTQATAGTWATAPSTIQGAGGNALTAMSSLGYGQTWQTVTRTSGTTYYNTTGKPIVLQIQAVSTAANPNLTVTVGGNTAYTSGLMNFANAGYITHHPSIIIPPGASYVVTATNASITATELR